MNAENYIRFIQYFKTFAYVSEHNPGAVQNFGNRGESFMTNLNESLMECKLFEIESEVKTLLALTNPPNKSDEVKLPFPYVFLDVSFTREELAKLGVKIRAKEMVGILFSEGIMVYEDGKQKAIEQLNEMLSKAKDDEPSLIIPREPIQPKPVLKLYEGTQPKDKQVAGRDLRITIFSFQQDDAGWFDTFNKNINLDEPFKSYNIQIQENPTTDKRMREFAHKFVINFLNFLHNPEVEYREHARDKKSIERRIKKGKVPLPSTTKIKITGQLKKYVDEVRASGDLGRYGYRFWVRGHFRRLEHPRYIEKRIIFIPPFIKGKGILIEKLYDVKREKDGATGH